MSQRITEFKERLASEDIDYPERVAILAAIDMLRIMRSDLVRDLRLEIGRYT